MANAFFSRFITEEKDKSKQPFGFDHNWTIYHQMGVYHFSEASHLNLAITLSLQNGNVKFNVKFQSCFNLEWILKFTQYFHTHTIYQRLTIFPNDLLKKCDILKFCFNDQWPMIHFPKPKLRSKLSRSSLQNTRSRNRIRSCVISSCGRWW